MGTRGAVGFRIGGVDKVMYNHGDSYPSWLGKQVVEFIKNTTIEEMRVIAECIQLVDQETKATPEQIEKYKRFGDVGVSTGELTNWYCLLRGLQGGLDKYRDDHVDIMLDAHLFLLDSLFCEYAYIINMDTQQFEFYEGFCDEANGPFAGRYGTTLNDDKTYYGVKLVSQTALENIQTERTTPFPVEEEDS